MSRPSEVDRLLQGMDLGAGAKVLPPQDEASSAPQVEARPAEEIFASAAQELPETVIAAMKREGVPKVLAIGHGWAVVFLVGDPDTTMKKAMGI